MAAHAGGDGLEAGRFEVLADEATRQVRAGPWAPVRRTQRERRDHEAGAGCVVGTHVSPSTPERIAVT